ncbi:MAG TPA: UbiA family prenyltransferase [Nitrososphaerales archaeon]|nr:UbiA family prenyltransferase [Nitrososphaerales archaeon]
MSEEAEYSYSGIACDNTGVITSYGIGAAKLFGWTADEVVGKQSVTIFHEPQAVATLVPRLLKTAAETGKFEEEVTLVRKDGSKFLGLLTVRPIKKGSEIVGYMGLTRPIKEVDQSPTKVTQGRHNIWIRELRAPFLLLPAIFVPVGLLMAWSQGFFNPFYAVLTLAGAMSLHASVNVLNDYFDFTSGIDLVTTPTPFSGGSTILPSKLLTPKSVLSGGLLFLLIGAGVGAYFVVEFAFNPIILLITGLAVVSILAYSSLLSKWGIGELVTGLNFGPLLLLGTYYVQTRTLAVPPLLIGTVLGILTACILYINEFPDVDADSSKGRRDLVVRWGRQAAASRFKALLASAYVILVLSVVSGLITPLALLGLLTIPKARSAARILDSTEGEALGLIPGMASMVMTTLFTGVLLAATYLIHGLIGYI